MKTAEKLIVALDYPDLRGAERMVKRLRPLVRNFKIGKELFTAEGPRAVERVRALGSRVFLDLKFHDIPNTVAAACAAAVRLGVFMLNVHGFGGRAMMERAAAAAREAAAKSRLKPPILLAVTVLTSLKYPDLKEVGIQKKVQAAVLDLARLAQRCGMDGVVASGREIRMLRRAVDKKFLIVTPGVRPRWAADGDQKRVVTPSEAVKLGADYLVVGRPITGHADPLKAAEMVINEMEDPWPER